MMALLAKDVRSFFASMTGYLVIGVFLTAMGLLLWVFPETSILESGYADMGPFFTVGPYVLIFLVPAVTMRSFAEEKRAGTLDLLLSKPLREWHLVLAKFLASWLLVILALLPGWLYYATVYYLGNPPGNLDSSGILGSYVGLLLLASAFCSVGIWISSITANQVVAFVVAAFACFLFFQGFESIADLVNSGGSLSIKKVGLLYHYDSMGRGLIDSRDVVYFGSVITFFLLLTKTGINSRLW